MNKKTFFSFFLFAVSALMSISLTSCGEDIQVPNNPNDDKIDPTEGVATVFSTSSDDTRTSMDTDRHFYWEAGDYIWVDTLKDGTFTGKSQGIELSNPTKAPSAKFYFRQIILTEQKYDLTYTGNNSNKGTEVTIAATQTQTEWNNAAHLGESGDCGVAEATRDNSTGIYSFSLKHKAAYIVFAPYKNASITDGWKLTKIEIIADGTTIAGTYPFSATGLNTSGVTNSSETVTLNCTDGFTLPTSSSDCCFAVIQPGTHTLSIRYTIKPTGSVNNVAGGTFTITKEIASRPYSTNGVTTIKHELNVTTTYPANNIYYMWDANRHYWEGAGSNYPKAYGESYSYYPQDASSVRWYNTVLAPTPASQSCKDMPNANEMSWYVMHGDYARWESNYLWYFAGNGGADICTCGVWLRKKQYIAYNPDISYDQTIDLRSSGGEYANSSVAYRHGGRPADTSLYFFLPAIPATTDGVMGGGLAAGIVDGAYWSSSPHPNSTSDASAYSLDFSKNEIRVNIGSRYIGRVVAPDWFQ